MRWTLATLALAVAFLAGALASGPHRAGALVGVSIAAATALVSMLALGRSTRWKRPMQGALAVMAGAFLVRLVLVALGTALVAAKGAGVVPFVVAFFVAFFAFAGLEAAYVHSLRRTGAA